MVTTNEPWHGISSNVVCATNKASDQPAHTRKVNNHTPKDSHYTINDLQGVPWDLIKLFDDPDDIIEAWTDLFLEVVDKHIPIKNTGLSEKPNLIG